MVISPDMSLHGSSPRMNSPNVVRPLIKSRTVCSATRMLGRRNELVTKAKMMSKHISMKKFSKPGKAAKKPADIPATVVMVVSKMV